MCEGSAAIESSEPKVVASNTKSVNYIKIIMLLTFLATIHQVNKLNDDYQWFNINALFKPSLQLRTKNFFIMKKNDRCILKKKLDLSNF